MILTLRLSLYACSNRRLCSVYPILPLYFALHSGQVNLLATEDLQYTNRYATILYSSISLCVGEVFKHHIVQDFKLKRICFDMALYSVH